MSGAVGPSPRAQQLRGLPRGFPRSGSSTGLYEDVDYREYWEGHARARQDALEKRLIAEALPASGRRMIDLGCGYGRLLPCYASRFKQIVLYDGSMSLLRQARTAAGDGVMLIAGDVASLPFKPAAFDTVLSVRVLQHLHDLDGALAEMRRVLARDGRLVFSYHNKRNVRRMLHYVVSHRIPNPYDRSSAEVGGAMVSHHPARVEAALLEAGFAAPAYRGAMVVNSIARVEEALDRPGAAAAEWASFTGEHWLAPWLVGAARATAGAEFLQATTLEDVLECPACHQALQRADAGFACAGCGHGYPIVDGITDMRNQEVA